MNKRNVSLATSAIQELGFRCFRSVAQRKLVYEVLACKRSVTGVLPTGLGKTLAIFVGLTDKKPGLTLVVYPLRSVYDDAVKRFKQVSIQTPKFKGAWKTWNPSGSVGLFEGTKVVLVTAEQARSKLFLEQVKESEGSIRRVIFDEAPVFVTSSFRLGLSSLPLCLRASLSCPFVLLTGTLRRNQEEELRRRFLCPGMRVIRGPTVRPEVAHKVVRISRDNVTAADVAKFVSLTPDVLTIVFVKTIDEVKKLATGLESEVAFRGKTVLYHGSLSGEERKVAAHSWKSVQKPIMIATTAFAYGIHSDKCRRIIHVEGAYDVDTYVQAAGRAGRDGRHAVSITLFGQKSFLSKDFSSFVTKKACRLVTLSSMFDSNTLQWEKSCGACDWCKSAGLVGHIVPLDWRIRKYTVHKPDKDLSPLQERCAASKYLAQVKSSLRRILFFCREQFCFTCFVLSRGRQKLFHGINACPHWRGRCFRCGSNCRRQNCVNQRVINKKLTEASLCVTCAMPSFIFDTNVHHGQFSMGRGCSYRDKVLPAMLVLWRVGSGKKDLEESAHRPLSTLESFLDWAVEETQGVPNLIHFLVVYLKSKTCET